jgi:triosephosphate isomerase
MRKKIVAGNWKMNKVLTESLSLVSEVRSMVRDEVRHDAEVIVIPPFTSLAPANKLIEGSDIILGAQNCSTEEAGAYTGEVSVKMLSSVGVSYVLVGHSERRSYFGETNEMLAKKVAIALNNGITPIYCCGETLENREDKTFFQVVEKQITEGLFGLHEDQLQKVVIAYEPVWAIGTGQTASAEQAQEMHSYIRKLIEARFGDKVANSIRILYGGSVNPKNASELFSCADIDGGLIGGASLKPRDFVEVVKAAK